MTKAVVIKTVGDPEIAGAIVDGMSKRVIPLDDGELASVKAEVVRLRNKDGLRAYGDQKRFRLAKEELAIKYSTKPVGRLAGAFLGVYGLFCLMAAEAYQRMATWNRE